MSRSFERVLLKPESGHPGFQSYTLVGAAADLEAVLRELLDAVARMQPRGPSGEPSYAVQVGDGTERYEHVSLCVTVDADLARHRRPAARRFWRFYDSRAAEVTVLVAIIAAGFGGMALLAWMR